MSWPEDPIRREKIKRKISLAKKGKPMSSEAKAKISAYRKGRPNTEEQKAKISATLKGHPVSEETRARISAGCRASTTRSSKQVGFLNPNWKGGRWQDDKGYIRVRAFCHPSAVGDGYIREHRLIAEKMLGRPLLPNEVVHHKNEEKADNGEDNLHVFSSTGEHTRLHKTSVTFSEILAHAEQRHSEAVKRMREGKEYASTPKAKLASS